MRKQRQIIDRKIFTEHLKSNRSNKEIAEKLNISSALVSFYLKKYKLKSNNPYKGDWSNRELNTLNCLYSNTPMNVLSKKLPKRSFSSIRRKAFELGLTKDISIYSHCSPQSNLSKLLINCPESFYWAGFITADGWFDFKKNSLGITLSKKDEHHLLKFAEYIQCKSIYYFKTKSRKISTGSITGPKDYISLRVTSKELIPQIIHKFDFKVKKTTNPPSHSVFSKFTDKELLSYLIGFIDGDGWMEVSKSCKSYRIGITSSKEWKEFLDFLLSKLETIYKLDIPKSLIRKDRPNQITTRIGKSEVILGLKKFISKNNLPVLERKWDKVVLD